MTAVLRTITREIATSLVSEVVDYSSLAKPIEPANQMASRSQLRLSEITSRRLPGLSRIARDVRQLKENPPEHIPAETNVPVTEEVPKVGLDKVEEKLNKIFNETSSNQDRGDTDIEKTDLDDFDDVDIETIEKLEKRGYKVIYPNLKYKKPKYQNVNEMLKYVESDSGKGDGVKLVIMNFND
jgi:hypothetical protein